MMLNKVILITSLLFILVGANVFAESNLENSTPTNSLQTFAATDSVKNGTMLATNDSVANTESKEVVQDQTLTMDKTEVQKPSFKDLLFPSLIGVLVVLGAGCYWFIFRKKYI